MVSTGMEPVRANLETLPVIDMSGLDGPERGRIGKEILAACETWGFFQCINHGLDMSTLKALQDASMQFFKLPLDEKRKWMATSSATYDGYWNPYLNNSDKLSNLRKGNQHLFNVTDPDPVKNLEHEQYYPSNPPTYKPALIAYFKETYALKKRLLAVLSESLGLESDTLIRGIEGGVGEARLGFRGNHYVPQASEDELAGMGLASHTDVASMLSILFSDEVPGLEIEHQNQWVKVDPVPGAYIINVGDPLEVLTNGRLRSVEHRAIAHQSKERFSCVVVTFPQPGAKIGPIPQLIDEDHPALYERTDWEEHMARFTKEGYKGKSIVGSTKLGVVKVP